MCMHERTKEFNNRKNYHQQQYLVMAKCTTGPLRCQAHNVQCQEDSPGAVVGTINCGDGLSVDYLHGENFKIRANTKSWHGHEYRSNLVYDHHLVDRQLDQSGEFWLDDSYLETRRQQFHSRTMLMPVALLKLKLERHCSSSNVLSRNYIKPWKSKKPQFSHEASSKNPRKHLEGELSPRNLSAKK